MYDRRMHRVVLASVLLVPFLTACADDDCALTSTCKGSGAAGGPTTSAGGSGGASASGGGGIGGRGGGGGIAKLGAGDACNNPNDCQSGFCVDDRCCQTSCEGMCEACGANGVCATHAVGTDPDDECGLATCNAVAQCDYAAVRWSDALTDIWLHRVAIDDTSSVIAVGRYEQMLLSSWDIHARRYTANGTLDQNEHIGATFSFERATALATDGSDILIAIKDANDIDVGGVTLPSNHDSSVVRLNSNFNYISAIGMVSSGADVEGIVSGPFDIVGVGSFASSLVIGSDSFTASGGTDAFAARLASSGQVTWARQFSGNAWAQAQHVGQSNTGIYVAGEFVDTVNLGGGPLTGGGSFLGKLHENSGHLWSQALDGIDINGLRVSAADEVVIAGEFSGTINLGGSDLVSSDAGLDVFVAKFDSSGAHVWSASFGGPGDDRGGYVGVNRIGQIVLAGSIEDSIDFGGGVVSTNGDQDVFVATLSADGRHVWTRTFGGTGAETAAGLDVAADGEIVLIGRYDGPLILGTDAYAPQSANGVDGSWSSWGRRP